MFLLALTASLAGGAAADAHAALLDPAKLRLASANALVLDASDDRAGLRQSRRDEVTPIASLTKLMTAMVTLDAGQSLDEPIAIDMDDLDYLKGTPLAPAHGRRAVAAAKCCARADGFGKPRGVVPRAALPRRHAGVRRGDERQGARRSA